MKRRSLSLLLGVVLTFTSVAACDTQDDNGQSDTTVTTVATTEDTTDAESEAEGTETETENNEDPSVDGDSSEYFPLDEQITISIGGVRQDNFTPFEEQTYFIELEEETNVKVEWLDWPQSIQQERRNLAFSSGNLPDALYGSWSLDKPDVVRYGGEGMLLDLNPYVNDDVMPNVNRLFNDVDELRTSLQVPSGELYVLATLNQNDLPSTNDTLLINTEWLQAVNKEMPTTTDELIDVLKAFRDAGDLNGNGQDDEIPMSFLYMDGNNGAFGLMGFTGIPAQNKNSRMVMKDGEPAFFQVLDEYKTYLTFLNELHTENLLDKEVFTMNVPTYNAKTQTSDPTIGVISSWTAETVNKPIESYNADEDGVYQYLPPLKGRDGVEPKWGMRVNPLNANLSFAVNADTEYPEEIARWIDLAYDKETSINNYVGKVGVHIQHEGGNQYSNILKEDGSRYSQPEMSSEIPKKFAVAWVLEGDVEFIDAIESPQNKNAADAVYGPYLETNYVNDYIMSTEDESNRMSLLSADIFAHADRLTAEFVTYGGIEEGWDDYIQELNDLGLEEYVQIKTDIHNRATSGE